MGIFDWQVTYSVNFIPNLEIKSNFISDKIYFSTYVVYYIPMFFFLNIDVCTYIHQCSFIMNCMDITDALFIYVF